MRALVSSSPCFLVFSANQMSARPLAFADAEQERVNVFEAAAPSVAYIQTSLAVQVPFARNVHEYPAGAGSGFVWDTSGHIVTNYHVIAGAPPVSPGRQQRGRSLPRKVTVKLQGCDEQVPATIVGVEPDKDLAVLKVDPTKVPVKLKALDVGISANLRVGQNVLAIGNPFGLDFTLTKGIVSALGRDIQGAGGRPIKDCVQTDAAINPGNSGGPLLDSRGRLIGVNTMIFAPGGIGANVGIGFAVPSDTVTRVVNQIINFGQNARPSLGVSILPDADRERYAKSLGRKLEGTIIADVVRGSPAARLKLSRGDMITSINGTLITENEQLLCAVEEAEPDQPLSITIMRSCDPKRVEEVEITPVRRKFLVQ